MIDYEITAARENEQININLEVGGTDEVDLIMSQIDLADFEQLKSDGDLQPGQLYQINETKQIFAASSPSEAFAFWSVASGENPPTDTNSIWFFTG